ncbi:hypothetical protein ACFC1B_06925 [Streptomyces xiamenensis]|uniref:hypothetical protein n=1 Tax=Streptomyces xiamenensis TaxID=408015 RepID=UPI0035DE7A65
MKIREITNEKPDFYQLLGPYLANRAVHKWIGDAIWDDDGKTWLVALHPDGKVAGFCGVITRRRRTIAESLYVTDPEDRDTAHQLMARTVKRFGHDAHLHAVVRHEHADAYTDNGFATVKETANFATLVRRATITQDTAHG